MAGGLRGGGLLPAVTVPGRVRCPTTAGEPHEVAGRGGGGPAQSTMNSLGEIEINTPLFHFLFFLIFK